jgi:DNA polymerase III gamma/tau subunit
MNLGQQFTPIKKSELPMNLETAQATSKEVSPQEFQETAARGQAHLDSLRSQTHNTAKMDKNLGKVSKHAYEATREEWGGATYSASKGKAVNFSNPAKHAVSAKLPGQQSVTVPADASEEHFNNAMSQARSTFSEQLSHPSHYLGVFHDADKGHIEIDPVVAVNGAKKAQEVGAATRATGGAYHFKSGNGVFPPHVAD